jgi:hypothetical protein
MTLFPIRETECLVRCGLAEAEADGALKFLASTYDPGSDRLYPGLSGRGPRALTFAPLLGSRFVRFSDLVARLLESPRGAGPTSRSSSRSAHRADVVPARFALPGAPGRGSVTATPAWPRRSARDGVVAASTHALGNGHRGPADIVYVRPEAFRAATARATVAEFQRHQPPPGREWSQRVLIGLGRWGPGRAHGAGDLAQISGACVIVEARPRRSYRSQPRLAPFSQLLSSQVLLSRGRATRSGSPRLSWLDRQPAAPSPDSSATSGRSTLAVRVDGANRRG